MTETDDRSRQPTVNEMCELVGVPLFRELRRYMGDMYHAQEKIEYSGDNALRGWNLKYRKAGRTLLTVYPRAGRFFLLLVVGRKEKERVEAMLPGLSAVFQELYRNTAEGLGQRWLLLEFPKHTEAFQDVLDIAKIRRESR